MNRAFLLLLIFSSFSCKTTYTGFNGINLNVKANQLLTHHAFTILAKDDVANHNTSEPIFVASIISESDKESNSKLVKLGVTFKKAYQTNLTNTKLSVSKKNSFKEKLITKALQRKLSKVISKPSQPDGFSHLDNKLKIGIILLLVALLLSAISLHGLAGLAGLVGLIFIIFGLLNTYN